MFGAAPGRETIFIFCICWINCGSLYVFVSFFRDGGKHFKNPEENEEPCSFLTRRVGCFYSQTHSQTTLHVHLTDSPAFNLFVYFFVLFVWQVEGTRGLSESRNVNLSLPLDKVLHRLFKPLLCFCFCFFFPVCCCCCRQTAWNNDTCKVTLKK